MAVLIIALIMAFAMMFAAFQMLQIEAQGESFRKLRAAGRGRFAKKNRS
jgi:hypothetical protein